MSADPPRHASPRQTASGHPSLEALADAAIALAGELELDAVLETIVVGAAAATGARYSALGVIGEDQTIVRFVTHGMDDETVRAIGEYPKGRGVLGLLIREPRIIRLDDVRAHPASYGFPPNHPVMTSFLGAPVRSGGRAYGRLYLTDKPGGFDAIDEQLIAVLAAQAGAAIENALLSARLRQLAVQEERERISRELHDGVIQTLFSVGMTLQSARVLTEVDTAGANQRIDTAINAVDQSIRDLRNAIFRLRPQNAAALGLARGLAELAREYEVNALVRPTLDVQADLDARVPGWMVPDILGATREALANAAKHARATSLTLRAAVSQEMLQVEIADNGVGFDAQAPTVGRGLDTMRERAAALGGGLQVAAQRGSGTTIRLSVPLQERTE